MVDDIQSKEELKWISVGGLVMRLKNLPLIGKFIYAIGFADDEGVLPPTAASNKQCSQCGTENPGHFTYCMECGNPLSRISKPTLASDLENAPKAASKICPECGFSNRGDVRFCEECGVPLVELVSDQEKDKDIAIPEPFSGKRPARMAFQALEGKPEELEAQFLAREGDRALVCPGCGFPNRPDVRFCEECGQVLKAVAPKELDSEIKTASREPLTLEPARPEVLSRPGEVGLTEPKRRINFYRVGFSLLLRLILGSAIGYVFDVAFEYIVNSILFS